MVPHEDKEAPRLFVDDLMIKPWGLKSAPSPYQIFDQQYRHIFDVSIIHSDVREIHLSHLSGSINKNLRSLIRVNPTHGEAT